ncbi:hypothetical protein FQN60_001745 [Etheostoma spectabile]|uniref:ETS domain-containing protein n=1 Tax=Etheostoma spectabile TaxID=54343 RepID=A0A5J5D7T7_9PERO|nr:hypothetical protein FQN60_001745 [Etheostoma spectabile]
MSMGSPGCEHTAHSPLYISHTHTQTMAWLDKADDVKPPRGLLGLPELSWPGVYLPCYDILALEESPWVLRMTEAPAPAAPPSRTPEPNQAKLGQPQDPPSGMEGQVEERSLEQVQTMVVGEVLKDVDTACKLLNIAPDPMDWSCVHVQKWLLWTEHLHKLPQVSTMFQELSGRDLCSMTEADFRQRSSQFGDMLYAHLDIWRSGIFKIEDSALVARLWGMRKNRPAMNYDKLSRSIRQYYKKGIIRKPDVSRRLVYQFVNPI